MFESVFLPEPELDFGVGGHVDVRFGVQRHSVLDFEEPAFRRMRIGLVGTRETMNSLRTWIEAISNGVQARASDHPNLFPSFPGIHTHHSFHLSLEMSEDLHSIISKREVDNLLALPNTSAVAKAAASLFSDRVSQLQEDKRVSLVLCALPIELAQRTLGEPVDDGGRNFHHELKAQCLGNNVPTQIVLPHTYDPSKKVKMKTKSGQRSVQDEATRAWNFVNALYYKGGGTPWRMRRFSSSIQTCYIGIGFYSLLDGSALQASVAHVFDERGDGVIVRGAMASFHKDDRRPFLSAEDSKGLLANALREYRKRHGHAPARVVIHKSSPFRDEEIEGLDEAVDSEHIEMRTYVSISPSMVKLFRPGEYPPMRGTLLEISDKQGILYTTGSNSFYQTYPGQYIPRPLHLRLAKSDDSVSQVAEDILALSKMNWNKTQMDGSLPITLEASRQVGNILKHVDQSGQVQNTYRFFM